MPDVDNIDYHTQQNTPGYLPNGTYWYYFYSGQVIPGEDIMQTFPIADNEQGVFVREGAIIPTLNFEKDRMSLLSAWQDPLNILIYPYVGGGSILYDTAEGDMYFDDGETNEYENGVYTWLKFNWSGALTVTKIVPDNINYTKASGKYINRAQIMNVSFCPVRVRNTYISEMPGQPETVINHICNTEENTVTLDNFFIPLDSGLVYDTPMTLFEFVMV